MKGRIVWVFWLVVVLASLTATASYAWLAMNTAAGLRGLEVELESDSLYLEISADAEEYHKSVSLSRPAVYSFDENTSELMLVSYGEVPSNGALLIYQTQLDKEKASNYGYPDGVFKEGGYRLYRPSDSKIGGGKLNFVEVTDTFSVGQSVVGYYVIGEYATPYPTASVADRYYYVKTVRDNGCVDYSCLGNKFEIGERLAGRKYWGYASSTSFDSSESSNIMNIVSMDTPAEDYCLKRTVFLRNAVNTGDAQDLRISSISILGRKNDLTDAIGILFVAKSDGRETVAKVYSHRNHENSENFDGLLFSDLRGDTSEVVTVDIYIYFDGKDENAHSRAQFLTANTVKINFSVDGHEYD